MSQCGDATASLTDIPVDVIHVIAENVRHPHSAFPNPVGMKANANITKIGNKTDLLSLRLASHAFDNILVPYLYQILAGEVQLRISMHLHRAAAICYDIAVQRLLVAKISPNCRDNVGETPLHTAVRNNCFVSVKMLLRAGATVDSKSYHEWTPVHFAARRGRLSILRELLRAAADVNIRGFHGWTALHYAARSGHLDATEMLLSAGADVYALDNDKRTAAQEAIKFGHYEVLRVLEECARTRFSGEAVGAEPMNTTP